MTLEELFKSTKLDVIVSEKVHDLPDELGVDWLSSVTRSKQRETAFFDERLVLFLTVKTPHPGALPINTLVPPSELALFLSHLQITLDAKYISPQPAHKTLAAPGGGINVTPPPRSHSYQKAAFASPRAHPSIFPPHTPNPTPQTDETDRQYVGANFNAEGTVLESFVWGETSREDPMEKNFAYMWSGAEKVWVIIYRLTVGVSFLRTSVSEPLLSLTVSATLRDKSLAMTPGRKELASLLQVSGVILNSGDQQTTTATVNGIKESEVYDDELHGLEEVNLLDGLSRGPGFNGSGSRPLSFPSTRLGANLRRSTYSLSPIQPMSPKVMSPITAATANAPRTTAPTLRKSFLKTLQTVSGFQIRMKSVFVPYVSIPGCDEDEGERREAGSEERTVVLSVELGNGSSFGGPGSAGFVVEGVDVKIGGEGAQADLIGWAENGFQESDGIFPLLLGPAEQFNLLYAITFLRQSEADEVADPLRSDASAEKLLSPVGTDKQRPVAIVIQGRPFDFWSSKTSASDDTKNLAYPTQSFRSRWNCVLDLTSVGHSESFEVSSDPPSTQDALPAPPSPFPGMTSNAAKYPLDKSTNVQAHAVVGIKRHTTSGLPERGQRLNHTARYRYSTPVLNASSTESPISVIPTSSFTGGKFAPTPPSIAISKNSTNSSAMNMASPRPGSRTPDIPPLTPAYPAYPAEVVPQTAAGQSPVSNLRIGGVMGHPIEPRRERTAMGGTPQTPGTRMPRAPFTDKTALQDEHDAIDPVVVSVGLLPPEVSASPNLDLIYSLDTFGIEIFVFNLSDRTRRFEVSYPDKGRRRQQAGMMETYPTGDSHKDIQQAPGIVPLENRIRVGPLRSHTCQSVRMQFLALRSGVHSISCLTLTDVETGYSMNLKSVMDVMIHETAKT